MDGSVIAIHNENNQINLSVDVSGGAGGAPIGVRY